MLLIMGLAALLLVLPRQLAGTILLLTGGAAVSIGVGYGVWRLYRGIEALAAWAWGLRGLSLGMALWAAWLLRPSAGGGQWPLAAMALAVGSFAYSLTPNPSPMAAFAPLQTRISAVGWVGVIVGVLSLTLVTMRALPGYPALDGLNLHTQHALFVFGIAAVVWGLGRGAWPSRPRGGAAWGIIGAAAFALALNVFRLGTATHHMPDEWIFVSEIVNVHENHPFLNLVSHYAASPWLYVYWEWIGAALTGGGLFGARFISAVMGAGVVAAVGMLAYEWFDAPHPDRRVSAGVLAAWIAAALPAQIHFSRMALYGIADPMFGLFAVALLMRGFRTGERGSFALAGACLGLTQYFYEAGKLLIPAALIVWLPVALVVIWRGARKLPLRGLLITAGLALTIGALPWLVARANAAPVLTRLEAGGFMTNAEASTGTKITLALTNVDESMLTFTTNSDPYWSPYFHGEQGMIPVWLLPLFAFGLMVMGARPFSVTNTLPLAWIFGAVLGVSFMNNPNTARLYLMVPVAAIVMAVALIHALRWARLPERWPAYLTVGVLALVGGAYYFTVHLPSFNRYHAHWLWTNETYDIVDAVQRTADLPPMTIVHVLAERHSDTFSGEDLQDMTSYFNKDVALVQIVTDSGLPLYLRNLPDAVGHTFFVKRDDPETLEWLETYFELAPPQTSVNEALGNTLLRYDAIQKKELAP